MRLPTIGKLAALPLCAAALALAGCGTASIELADNDPDYEGAELFVEHCSGCHTFEAEPSVPAASNVWQPEQCSTNSSAPS